VNKKILIVEDSKVFSQSIKDALEKEKNQCFQAFTFKDAKQAIKDNDFDLIVLDLHLPDGEGDELIKNIKSLIDTKVVVLTADGEKQLREQLFQMGILDYIIKDKNILHTIQELLKIVRRLEKGKFGDVLIVDDSKFICKQIKLLLEPRNYDVDIVYSGEESLKKIKEKQYDLIILDFELPNINGDEVLIQIKKDKNYTSTPILILSGSENQDRIRKVLKSGASDYIKKPFFIEEFILKIDYFIDNSKKDKKILDQTNKLNMFIKTLKIKVENEVKKNEQQQLMLFAQSRHAQMGEMLSMIAHQWRQPLNALSLVNQMIIEKLNSGKIEQSDIDKFQSRSKKQIIYMSETIDSFKNFFTPKSEKEDFYILDTIKDTLFIIEPVLENYNITYNIEVSYEKLSLNGYSKELNQAILNILNNAKDALIQKNISNKFININISQENSDILLYIEDNAGGIPKDIIQKVFDPYFSTKVQKNGTGLGLYMTKTIIEDKFKGTIKVSNKNDGALFKITLPIRS